MADKINLENEELVVLIEFENSNYGKILLCSNSENKNIFVINNMIVRDEKIINEINKKYGLEPKEKIPNILIG